MKKQAFNPFLPLNEYIPDGEPHVFGDRVYLFGSHDKENGDTYCMMDYVVYSAPVDDLSDWSCKGVSFSSKWDPTATKERSYLYAPDVVRGNDGRFYLYYCLSGSVMLSASIRTGSFPMVERLFPMGMWDTGEE